MDAPDEKDGTSHRGSYHAPKQKRHDGFEYATLITAIIGVIVLCVYTGLTGYQAAIARDTERQQLRAYVYFDAPKLLKVTQSDTTINVDNFGQTPAKDVEIFSSWEFVPFGTDLPDDFQFLVKPPCAGGQGGPPDQKVSRGPVTVFPKNPYPAHYFNCPFDAFDLARTEKKEVNAFLYGFIRYTDIFDEPHRTNFCFLYYPAIQSALFCSRHNEVDPKQYYQ